MPLLNIAYKDEYEGLTPESTDAEIRAHAQVREDYGDILDLFPHHPVVIVPGEGRILRWKENKLLSHIITENYGVNRMWQDFSELGENVDEMAAIYCMMGYSLCGFVEVLGGQLGLYAEANPDA